IVSRALERREKATLFPYTTLFRSRRLDGEGQLRSGARGDVERRTGYGGEPAGARPERVARTGLVEAQIEEGPHPAHRRYGRGAAECRAARIVPQRDRDGAAVSRRDVTEGIERPHFYRGADRVVRHCRARLGAEHQMRRGPRGDGEEAARRRAESGRAHRQPVARAGRVEREGG